MGTQGEGPLLIMEKTCGPTPCFILAINMFRLNISMRLFFEHPIHMFKMMVKKKKLPEKFCLSKPWLPIG